MTILQQILKELGTKDSPSKYTSQYGNKTVFDCNLDCNLNWFVVKMFIQWPIFVFLYFNFRNSKMNIDFLSKLLSKLVNTNHTVIVSLL